MGHTGHQQVARGVNLDAVASTHQIRTGSQHAPAVPVCSQYHRGSAGMCITAPPLWGGFWLFVY